MPNGIITRKELIEDQAMNIGPDYAKNMQPAIDANKQLVASLKELAPLINAFRKTDSQQAYIALKQQENLKTLEAINANKLREASELSLEKIKQAKLKTEKDSLTVQDKIEKAKKQSKDVLFYLIGVLPEYQNKAVTAIIFKEYYETFKEKGIINCFRTPELADNLAIHNLWKHFNPVVHKRRCTFRKDLKKE